MRSAEKARKSTCHFADDVARLTIDHFHSLCPLDLKEQYETNQTVLASFVIQWKESKELEVLSLATGTKVLSENVLQQNRRLTLIENLENNHKTLPFQDGDTVLRDMHAEILARRGMIRYFLELISVATPLLDNHFLREKDDNLKIAENNEDSFTESNNPDYREATRYRSNNDNNQESRSITHSLSSNNIGKDNHTNSSRNYNRTINDQLQLQLNAYERLQLFFEIVEDESRKWSLRWRNEKVSLHLYTSSAPCGNACLKQFAPKKKAKNNNTNINSIDNEFEYKGSESFPIAIPLLPGHSAPMSVPQSWFQFHESVQFTHVAEGQVALTVKVNTVTDNSEEGVQASDTTVENKEGLSSALCSVFAGKGRSLSCSDKILRWNCTGVQGGILAAFMASNNVISDNKKSDNNMDNNSNSNSENTSSTMKNITYEDSRILLDSIIIGRKYSEHHASRALCCRAVAWCLPCVATPNHNNYTNTNNNNNTISDNNYNNKDNNRRKLNLQYGIYKHSNYNKRVHHPAILCTAVKLREGGISATQGAQFNETRVFVACQSIFNGVSLDNDNYHININNNDNSNDNIDNNNSIDNSDILKAADNKNNVNITKNRNTYSGFISEIIDSKSGKGDCVEGTTVQDAGISCLSSVSLATLARHSLSGDKTSVSRTSYSEWKRLLCSHCVSDTSFNVSRHSHYCYYGAKDHLQKTLKHLFLVSRVSPPQPECNNNDTNNLNNIINNHAHNDNNSIITTRNTDTVSCWPMYKPL